MPKLRYAESGSPGSLPPLIKIQAEVIERHAVGIKTFAAGSEYPNNLRREVKHLPKLCFLFSDFVCSPLAIFNVGTRSLAVEWSSKGVLVNAIAPGVFRTALNADLLDNTPRGKELLMRTPMGRFGKTEEVVGAAVYLASDSASFVTGQVLIVDGGFLASGVDQ